MNYGNRILATIAIVALFCSGQDSRASVNAEVVLSILIDGEINDASLEKLRAARASIKNVKIRSYGGSAYHGLLMAKIVEERQLTVTVRDYCISACAYIFFAAKEKILPGGAILGLHGTGTSFATADGLASISNANSALESAVTNAQTLEARYFAVHPGLLPLYQCSGEATKALGEEVYFILAEEGAKPIEVPASEAEDVLKQVSERSQKSGKDFTFTMERRSKRDAAIYFPTLSVLRNANVRGISIYQRPSSSEGLMRLARQWLGKSAELISESQMESCLKGAKSHLHPHFSLPRTALR